MTPRKHIANEKWMIWEQHNIWEKLTLNIDRKWKWKINSNQTIAPRFRSRDIRMNAWIRWTYILSHHPDHMIHVITNNNNRPPCCGYIIRSVVNCRGHSGISCATEIGAVDNTIWWSEIGFINPAVFSERPDVCHLRYSAVQHYVCICPDDSENVIHNFWFRWICINKQYLSYVSFFELWPNRIWLHVDVQTLPFSKKKKCLTNGPDDDDAIIYIYICNWIGQAEVKDSRAVWCLELMMESEPALVDTLTRHSKQCLITLQHFSVLTHTIHNW